MRRSFPHLLLTVVLVGLAASVLSACGKPSGETAGAEASAPGSSGGRAIQNKGSDTMVNLALAWAEAYRVIQPDVDIAVTGGGSGTGIAALINGTVDLANASREMKDQEIEDAKKNGVDPVEHQVAVDALAVIVNLERRSFCPRKHFDRFDYKFDFAGR